MSYTAAETGVLTTLRLIDNGATYTTQNSGIEQYKLLDAPTPQSAIVFMAGATERGDSVVRSAHGTIGELHSIGILVAIPIRQTDVAEVVAACKTAIDALVAHLDRYEQLGGAAVSAKVVRVSAPDEIRPRMSGGAAAATHITQIVTLRVATVATPNVLEVGQ